MKVLFLGHFSNYNCVRSGASAAGDAVQRKIVRSLEGLDFCDVSAISQRPARSWPKDKLLFSKSKDKYAIYPSIINFAFLRDLCFGLSCFVHILKLRPNKVVQYNSYLFVNIFVILASLFIKFEKIVIVQDYRVVGDFKLVSRLHDKIAGRFVRFYSFVIPVTDALAKELKLRENQFSVFPGALEHDGLLDSPNDFPVLQENSTLTILYAGALERHNGVDKLIRAWRLAPNNANLLIYGRGTLEKEVSDADRDCENVSYLGFASKEEIHAKMLTSDFNVCFRFSDGLDERFFFPSKFFSINCYPGFALINEFCGLPDGFKEIGILVDPDLSNLPDILNMGSSVLSNKTRERQNYLYSNFRWSVFLKGIISDE